MSAQQKKIIEIVDILNYFSNCELAFICNLGNRMDLGYGTDNLFSGCLFLPS